MFLDERSQETLFLYEHEIPMPFSKKTWMPPQLLLLSEFSISNNQSGGGDGDAALAHS